MIFNFYFNLRKAFEVSLQKSKTEYMTPNMLKYIGIFLGLFFSNLIFSQEEIQDSINGKVLNEITIKGYRPITDIKQLGSIHQTYIIAGKKMKLSL